MIVDPYLDSSTTPWVLRNLLGHTDRASLRRAEDEYAADQLALLDGAELPAEYGWPLLSALHHWLFGGIYDWAGRTRTVGIAKGPQPFTPPELIAEELARFEDRLSIIDHGPDRARFVEDVASLYEQLNHIHPFREGNGRAQRAFWELYCAENGHPIDWGRFSGPENDAACEAGGAGDLAPLRGMFDRILD